MFSVTSQLNWLHKVLSFICQGSKPELSVAFRSGYNALQWACEFSFVFFFFFFFFYCVVLLYGGVNVINFAFFFFLTIL